MVENPVSTRDMKRRSSYEKKTDHALFLAGVLAVSSLTACGSSDSASSDGSTADAATSGDTLKIGLVAPISGDNGQYGTSQKQGYELAIKEINEAGGVNGQDAGAGNL